MHIGSNSPANTVTGLRDYGDRITGITVTVHFSFPATTLPHAFAAGGPACMVRHIANDRRRQTRHAACLQHPGEMIYRCTVTGNSKRNLNKCTVIVTSVTVTTVILGPGPSQSWVRGENRSDRETLYTLRTTDHDHRGIHKVAGKCGKAPETYPTHRPDEYMRSPTPPSIGFVYPA